MIVRQSYKRLLLHNLRLSFFVALAAAGAVAAYAIIVGEAPEWQIVLFVAIGMVLSSLINALIDSRRERTRAETTKPE